MTPTLSVLVPARNAADLLVETLGALEASDLPRQEWDLWVIDDGSTDATAEVASKWADHVLRLPAPSRGPGGARNAAASVASGTWLVFIDADVRVHTDTLSAFIRAVRAASADLVAVFGAYDARPAVATLVSQYRNLLHRYVHLEGAGEVDTFWAGCGAVRRDAFLAVGGFDTAAFPRPQIEDIDLGYRLRDRGGRILLDPRIAGTHLKRWTLRTMIRTDILDRGIPWTRLLLVRNGTGGSLNTTGAERVKVALAGLLVATLVGTAATRDSRVAWGAGVLVLVLLLLNGRLLKWFAAERGVVFAAGVAPLHLVHLASAAVAAACGIALHVLRGPWDRAAAAHSSSKGACP